MPPVVFPFIDVSEWVNNTEVILEGEKLSVGDDGKGVAEDYGIVAGTTDFRGGGMVKVKIEMCDGLASVCIEDGVGVLSWFGIGDAVPFIGIAMLIVSYWLFLVEVAYLQVHEDLSVAAILVGTNVWICVYARLVVIYAESVSSVCVWT